MALEPAARYQTPKLLAEDIERWLADQPVSAWPEPLMVKARRWVGRHRALVTGAAAALLVGVVSLVSGLALLGTANQKLSEANVTIYKREAETQKANQDLTKVNKDLEKAKTGALALAAAEKKAREDAEKEKKHKEEELKRSETLLYYATFQDAAHYLEKNDLVAARESLDYCRWDMRGPEYGYLAKQCEKKAATLFGHTDGITCLALSADGKRLFSCPGSC